MLQQQAVSILGSTGSIGRNTLQVLSEHPQQFRIFALSCYGQIERLLEQIKQFSPKYAVVANAEQALFLRGQLKQLKLLSTEILFGDQALLDIASSPEVNIVMSAIVGAAGMLPSLAAAKSGKRLLLANKEALVCAGHLMLDAVAASGAELLPVDSEHNAIFQSLPQSYQRDKVAQVGIHRLILTASGGPFLHMPLEQLSTVTPEQACSHPRWEMGKKISVDSATMMNKGLEIIEAYWLFNIEPSKIQALIHPQSIIHSMVEYIDGSTIAQLSWPDMRVPIAHALSYPKRRPSKQVRFLELAQQGTLSFEELDSKKFPCINLAYQALQVLKGAPVVINAANEVAVEAFLQGKIRFTQIYAVIAQVFDRIIPVLNEPPNSVEHIIEIDEMTRNLSNTMIKNRLN